MKEAIVQKAPNPLAVVVGANIILWRKVRGLTQVQLAKRIGIGQQSLSRMEKGRIAPRFERLQGLADALGCSVPELFRAPDAQDNDLAASLADIISPLSEASRVALVGVVAEMVRAMAVVEQREELKC